MNIVDGIYTSVLNKELNKGSGRSYKKHNFDFRKK
jgi:hypothetical protein